MTHTTMQPRFSITAVFITFALLFLLSLPVHSGFAESQPSNLQLAQADPLTQWVFLGDWSVELAPKTDVCGLSGDGKNRSTGTVTELIPIPPKGERWRLQLEIIGTHIVRLAVRPESGAVVASFSRTFANIPKQLAKQIEAERETPGSSFSRAWRFYEDKGQLCFEGQALDLSDVLLSFPLTATPPESSDSLSPSSKILDSSSSTPSSRSGGRSGGSATGGRSSPTAQWTRMSGSSGSDFGTAVFSQDGYMYVAADAGGSIDGQSYSGAQDFLLKKYSSAGAAQWTRIWGSSSAERARGIAIHNATNIYVGGSTRGVIDGQPNRGRYDICVTKYSPGGTRVWVRTRGTNYYDYGTGVAVDGSGNVYVSGYTDRSFDGQTKTGADDACLIKYDSAGNWQWTRLWGSTSDEETYGVAVDESGYIYVGGITWGSFGGQTNQGYADFFLSKFDSSGNAVWHRIFGTSGEQFYTQERGKSIELDPCGNPFLTGTTGPAGGYYYYFIAKYDSDGSEEWRDSWGSTSNTYGAAIAVDKGGDAYVAGTTYGGFDSQPFSGTQGQIFLLKHLSNGDWDWTRIWGSSVGDFGFGACVNTAGEIYVTGAAGGSIAGQSHVAGNDIFVSKWTDTINSFSPDVISVAPETDKAVVSTGTNLLKSDFIIVTDPPGCIGLVDVAPLSFPTAGVIDVVASSGSSAATTQVTVLEADDTLSVGTMDDIESVPLDTNNVPIYTTTVSQAASAQLQMAADAQGVPLDFDDWTNMQAVARDVKERGLFDNWLGSMFADLKALVFDPVHVASGDFYVNDVDFSIAAPTPIEIRRTYSTANLAPSELGTGWQLSHPYYLFVNNAVDELAAGVSLPTNAEVRLSEVDGTALVYSRSATTTANLLLVNGNTNAPTEENRRVNNFNGFGASARSNLKNNQVEYTSSNRSFTVYSGNGLVRHFEWQEFGTEGEDGYRNRPYLVYEQYPNGNRLVYEYNTDGLPSRIEATDSDESTSFNSATFSYDANNRIYSVTASDSRVLTYHYDSFGDLIRVARPDGTEVVYDYEHFPSDGISDEYSTHRITALDRPDNRTLENEYFEEGDVVGGETLTNGDYRIGRILLQKVTQDSPSTLVTNAIFSYSMVTNSGDPDYGSGQTIVLDALANKTVYRYDTNKHLTATERYLKARDANGDPIMSGTNYTYELYSIEQQDWSDGNLTRRTLSDASTNAYYCWRASYDDRGNLLTESVHGNLTGDFDDALEFDTNGVPINGESATNSYTYTYSETGNTNDPLNLIVTATRPNERVTRFVYDPGTNGNLIARFVCEPDGDGNPTNNPIYSRVFHEYNTNSVVTKTIADNGTSSDKGTLTGVTQRNIHEFTPGADTPTYGLPETIVNKFYDGSEQTLLTLQLSYDSRGNRTVTETYNGTNGFLFASTNQYDLMNRLTSRSDPNGDRTTLTYDDNGNQKTIDGPRTDITDAVTNSYDYFDRLTVVTRQDGMGNTLIQSSTFDAFGNELVRTNIHGDATSFEYDDLHRLTQTILPAITDAASNTVNPTVMQTYDLFGNVASVSDPNSNQTIYVNNVRGQRTEIQYADNTGETFEYSLHGNLTKAVAANGSYTVYEYDFLDRVTNLTVHASDDTLLAQEVTTYNAFNRLGFTDANTNSFTWEHDGAGRLTAALGPGATDERSKVSYSYDSLSRVIETKVWFGSNPNDYTATVLEYDNVGQVLSEVVEESDGTVRSRRTYEYDEAGNRTALVTYPDAATNGAHTVTSYDALRNPVSIEDALSNETQIVYDYSGAFEMTETDPLGNKTIRTHDALGRISALERKDSTNGLLSSRTYKYDPVGNRTRWIETVITPGVGQSDVTAAWSYNDRNRPASFTEALGSSDERATFYHYNDVGQLSSVRNPNNVELFNFYDDRGRLRDLIAGDNSIRYRYGYDPKGNVLSVYDTVQDKTTARQYDAYDRVVQEDQASGMTVEYAYDRAGRRTRALLPGSNAVDYAWNAAYLTTVQRMTNVTSLAAAGQLKYEHAYTNYDLAGNLLHATLATGQGSTFEVDELNRRTAIYAPHWTQAVSVANGYDEAGNLHDFSVSDPAATGTYSNQYDDLYRLSSETINHGPSTINHFSYDSIGNRLTLDESDYSYSYNDLNELLEVTASSNIAANVRVPVSGLYGMTTNSDEVASVTVQLDSNPATNAVLFTNETWELFTDGLPGIEIPADGANHTLTITATTTNSIINTKVVTVSYDASNAVTYAWDANGNLIQKTVYGTTNTVSFTHRYDALNRLTRVTKGSLVSSFEFQVSFTYDPFSRRMAKTISMASVTSVVHYLWTDQSEIGCADDSGNLLQLRVLGSGLGNDIGAAVGIELRTNAASAWTVYVPVHDQRGNVVLLLNQSTGAAVEYYRYDAFGNVQRFGTDTGNPWLFSSKRLDDEIYLPGRAGLIYFNRRYYDPETGRFITTDPLGYLDGFNRYAYVGNNPLIYVDPAGLLAKQAGQTVSAWADANWDLIDDDWHYMPTMNYLDYEGRWVQATLQNSLFAPAWNFVSGAMYPVTDVMFYGSDSPHAVFFFIATHPEVAMQVKYTTQAMGPLVSSTFGRMGQWFRRTPATAPKTTSLQKYYPDNNGFLGQSQRQFLEKGQLIDRYGGSGSSRFFSPAGTPAGARSLPAGSVGQPLRTFEVMKPFEVNSGTVAPAFGQPGFGTQFQSPIPLETLLKRGIISGVP